LLALEGSLTLATGYSLVLLGTAAMPRHDRPTTASGDRLRFIILIPAHNEETGINGTFASLRRMDYPGYQYEIVILPIIAGTGLRSWHGRRARPFTSARTWNGAERGTR
jgi:hypothetical protein